LPFTGVVAESAREEQECFLMYIDEQGGTLGGLPVEVIFEDTETQAEMVVTKTKKLIDHDQVHLLSGGMLAFEAVAAMEPVIAAKIAFVSITSASDVLAQLGSPYMTNATVRSGSQETMPFGEYAYNVLGYRKMAILGQDYTWGWETTAGFHFAFERAGGQIVQKLWAPIGTVDYAPFVTQLRRDVDAVYTTLIGADIPRFVNAYSDYGLKDKIPLLASEDLVAEDSIRYYGDEALGIIGVTPFTVNLVRPEMQRFVEAYQTRTGKSPTFWGEGAYLAAMAIDRGLRRLQWEEGVPAHELPEFVRNNAERLISAIRATDFSDAPSGPIRVDEFNNAIRNFYLVKLVKKDGKIIDEPFHTFPEVSQFWTFDPEEFMAQPMFSREFPPVIHD